jgi:putative ABC transport system permease protein
MVFHMWRIALKTLVADRGKLLTALIGVVFSIVLVNVQGGLFIGLIRKASLLVENVGADVWVGHKHMHNVDFPQDIPALWLDRVRSAPGVSEAQPYLIGFTNMVLPSGGFESVVVIGADSATLFGSAWNLREGTVAALRSTDGVIVDECDDTKLESPRLGDVREIGGRKTRIVGKSCGITGFLVAPYVFTTYDRAQALLEHNSQMCSYFLVHTRPGADLASVCTAIERAAPELDAMPRADYAWMSISFWMTRTGLGISFGAATLLGLFVGLIMVAQTLYASVLDRLREFGTLKAMGALELQLYSILLIQAVALALVGSLVGLILTYAIQSLFGTPRSPIEIPWWLSQGSCLIVLFICLLASLLPYLRVRRVDPILVLQT